MTLSFVADGAWYAVLVDATLCVRSCGRLLSLFRKLGEEILEVDARDERPHYCRRDERPRSRTEVRLHRNGNGG